MVAPAPPLKSEPLGAFHAYLTFDGTTPFTPSCGVTINGAPLHTVVLIALITGFGSTVTTTLNAAPVQYTVAGITEYVTLYDELVGLDIGPPNMFELPVVCDWPPDIDPLPYDGWPHVYVIPVGTNPSVPFNGVNANDVPVHIVRLIVLITGVGFTYTVTVNALPDCVKPEH